MKNDNVSPERKMKIIREMLTENDNLTYDVFRILAVAGVAVFFGLAIANWNAFDAVEFGTGFGAVLLAAGGAVRLVDGTAVFEPKQPPKKKKKKDDDEEEDEGALADAPE